MLARLIPLLLAAPAIAGEIVVHNAAATQAGPGGYSTLLNSAARSYQLVVGPSELSGIPAGSRITGIAWRRPSWQAFAAWPGTGFACTFANYDITLSDSLRAPGSLSTTYTDNIAPDAVLVRSGPLVLSGPFFPGGAVTPATNPFGTTIAFAQPYTYTGGRLLLTVRHSGNNCGGSGSLDTVGSTAAQATGVSSYTQPDNWYAQGPIVMKLFFEPPAPCDPDVNRDGNVDQDDVAYLINVVGGGPNPTGIDPDFNRDGNADQDDVAALIDVVAGGNCP
jgi:hypothetical protein